MRRAVIGDAPVDDERSEGAVKQSWQAHALRRLDQTGRDPGLAQDVGVEELQPIQIELDRAPGMRGH